ncbi:MAG: ABC transporter permease [Crocinitomicaceae bacterium]|nr:ABC transporter permease [Crocinitomicaceae bacterium]MCF8410614.1 ABC transporter permease [Crocinitomicaceae bacterium]MCF8444073.1 ABC transporter permease [Crocinitomicaceae bacterium]
MTEKWTEVISPKRSLLDINLKEIWRYRDLIMLFVRRDFVSQYKQTILGPIWLFIQPLFTTLTFFFVFNQIAKIPTDNIDPILFYLSGITLWNYFSDCFNKTSNTFVANAGIFGKVYFPRLATPISIVFSNLIKLGIQVLLFLAIMGYQIIFKGAEVNINLHILILPFLIILMAVMGLGLGIIFSALTTKYRDLSFLLTFGIQLLMYATPIIYPLSYTSGKLHTLISMNPLTPILESFRYAFFSIGTFDWSGLAYTSIFSFSVLFFGIIIFNQVEKSFMDTV